MMAARLISRIVEYRAVVLSRVVICVALEPEIAHRYLICSTANKLKIKPPACFLRNQNGSTRTRTHYFHRCENHCMEIPNHPLKETHRKPYEKPVATQLTPEEAKRKLIDQADGGSQEAKDLLEMIFANAAEKLSTSTKSRRENGVTCRHNGGG